MLIIKGQFNTVISTIIHHDEKEEAEFEAALLANAPTDDFDTNAADQIEEAR